MIPGELLGKYRVLGALGAGGMGGVYLGEDAESRERVAIKAMHRDRCTPDMLNRFVREAETIRRLQHPNIVRYVASGVKGRVYYLVLEKVEGKTLEETLASAGGPLAISHAVQVALTLLSALGYAHRSGVIHRDVKPRNVMVQADGSVKLLDFGIAVADDALVATGVGSVLGSFCYASPEQNQGQEVDERTDLYSTGLLLWEMLTGERALKGENLLAVTSVQVTMGIPPPSSRNRAVPRALDVICGRLLEKNRTERFTHAEEAIEALQAFEGL